MKKKFTIIEVFYVLPVVIFSVALHRFNATLLAMHFSSDFALLKYSNYAPLKFFFGAFVLVIAGACLILWLFQESRRNYHQFEEMLLIFAFAIVNVLLIVWVICLITIPILRAIMGCTVVIIGLISLND